LTLSIGNSFLILNIEAFFKPGWEKSGWFGASRKSVADNFPGGTIEEMKAITTSNSCGLEETTTAGRSFSVGRLVKGKGTRTISPRLRRVWGISIDSLSVFDGINVFARTAEEIVTASFLATSAIREGGKPSSKIENVHSLLLSEV